MILNITPFVVIGGISHFERLKTLPNYLELRAFGSTCFILLPKLKCDNLFKRANILCFWPMILGKKGIGVVTPLHKKIKS